MKSTIVAGIALLFLASCTKHAQTPLTSSEGMVQTPYGLVPASRVHQVDNHTVAKLMGGRLRLIDINNGQELGDLGVPTAVDRAATDPYAFAQALRGEVTVPLVTTFGTNPAFGTPGPTGRNEQADYTQASLSGIQSLSTNWLVPNYPMDTVNNGTLFWWNALSGGALQPVLQYNEGLGNVYSLANWYFTYGHYFHGPFIRVAPGVQLTGVVTFISNPDDTTWNYKESFTGFPAGDVYITRTSEAVDPAICFESYTKIMSQWPNQPYIQFTNIRVTMRQGPAPDSLHFTGGGDQTVTPSLLNAVIVNSSATNGEVDMYFGDGTGITPDSSFYIVTGLNGTSLLDLYYGWTFPGNKVTLFSPDSPLASNQLWRAVALSGGYYAFLSGSDNTMALTDTASAPGYGAQIVIEPYTGAPTQAWKVKPVGGGYNTLSPAAAPNTVMDVFNSQTNNGNAIQLWWRNGGTNQQFKFVME
ncbi:RICIN domain-containing protein [Dinghuibacter silviterrae]|uniref:Ricin-type beta-trefoil lectin protein n=1 Tax=Dinghuibacter silviterrae TaxID=1539049 RepID=A0A4R8DEK5_9BACT|nr:RICIN domain-containing protein [Dinghuibacter silviterrae]TDW95865.1 ricin-type beta-trefoil lectin protein [Dinghuibacter silviterrae]